MKIALIVILAIASVALIATGVGAIVGAKGLIATIGAVAGLALKLTIGGVIVAISFPAITEVTEKMLLSEFYLPMYSATPYEIFSNKIPLFDVNFFDSKEGISQDDLKQNTAYQLREVIAKLYARLRMIAIVGMLSVLVYIGIRIIISSAAKDKAKYKQFFVDWIVGMCLLFSMHYIMNFSVLFVEKITNLIINSNTTSTTSDGEILQNQKGVEEFKIVEKNGRVENAYKILVENASDESQKTLYKAYFKDENENDYKDEQGNRVMYWFTMNFMQQARMKLQLLNENGESTWIRAGYAVIFLVLVIDTLIYSYTYVRRVIYMAFLTLIAPLLAFTYPIDKANDGQAQGFNMWLKEYIFNLLIQPMHLLMYMILVGSAIDLAANSPIYAAIAIGFMIPAEKLLRQFFGFQKASTPGTLPGSAGGALMMQGIGKLTGWGPHGRREQEKSNNSNKDDDKQQGKVRTKSIDEYETISNGMQNGQNEESNALEDSMSADTSSDSTETESTMSPDTSSDSTETESTMSADTSSDSTETESTMSADTSSDSTETESTMSADTSSDSTETDSTVSEGKKPSRFGRVAGAYVRNLSKKNRVTPSLRGMARVTGKMFGGAVGAGIGLAIGVATGDPSKVFQNSVIGAKGGANLTGRGVDAMSDRIKDVTTIDEATKAAWYGEKYDEHLMKKQIKEWKSNKQNMDKLRINLQAQGQKGNDQYEKLVRADKGKNLEQYLRTGITDASDIYAAEKFRMDNPSASIDQAIAAVKIANSIGDYESLGAKGQKEANDTLMKNFRATNSSLRGDIERQNPNLRAQVERGINKKELTMDRIKEDNPDLRNNLRKAHPEYTDAKINEVYNERIKELYNKKKELYDKKVDNLYEEKLNEMYDNALKKMCEEAIGQITEINKSKNSLR